MRFRTPFAVLFLVALIVPLACGAPDDGEQPMPGPDAPEGAVMPQGQMDPEAMALMVELQELQARLGPIHNEAMESEALAAQLDQIQTQVDVAMREADPELFERIDRFEAEFDEAQEAGDQERIQALSMEAQGVQAELQALQADVLDRPEIRGPIEDFEMAQRARMIEIDPEVAELLERIDEVLAELQGG